MIYDKIISGRYVDLRSATLDDAEFTLSIRLDPEIRKCFPPFEGTLETQKAWLTSQMQKDNDYFFVVIEKSTGERIGTVSVYDIDFEKRDAETGRYVIKSENPIIVAEVMLLLHKFVFEELDLQKIHGFVLSHNKRAIRLNKFFGATFSSEIIDEKNNIPVFQTKLLRENFQKVASKISKYIYTEK